MRQLLAIFILAALGVLAYRFFVSQNAPANPAPTSTHPMPGVQ